MASHYELSNNDRLGKKSWFHWCPNTHLHRPTRLWALYRYEIDYWGRRVDTLFGWYCIECELLELDYSSWTSQSG